MRNKFWILFILGGILIVTTLTVQACKNRPAQCALCEREIHPHMQVSVTRDSVPIKTCCMSCALTYKNQTKNVQILTATDFLTDAQLEPDKAFYVVQSDVSPCTHDRKIQKVVREPNSALYECYDRCEPSILAFQKKADAETFQNEHGGRLLQFSQLNSVIPMKGAHVHD